MNIEKVKYPFCSEVVEQRGSGCCYCDHPDIVLVGEGQWLDYRCYCSYI